MEWISIENKVPELDVEVLGYDADFACNNYHITKLINITTDRNGVYYEWGGDWSSITHWMPLPEPPKQ